MHATTFAPAPALAPASPATGPIPGASPPCALAARTPDAQAVLLLCYPLAGAGPRHVPALDAAAYHRVATALAAAGARPAALTDPSPAGDHTRDLAARAAGRDLAPLLGRAPAVAAALHRLAAGGFFLVCRAEPGYPASLRRLGADAPPLLWGLGDPARLAGLGALPFPEPPPRDLGSPGRAAWVRALRAEARETLGVARTRETLARLAPLRLVLQAVGDPFAKNGPRPGTLTLVDDRPPEG